MKRIATLLLVISSLACGDINPAEELLTKWETTAEASLLVTSGNTEVTTIGLGLGTSYMPDPWKFRAKGNYLTSRSSGATTAENYDALLRGERNLSDDLSGFAQASYLRNEFTGFRDRYAVEGGAAYRLLYQYGHTLSAELGLGVIKELLISGLAGSPLGDRTFMTGRLGLDYRWKLSPSAEFGENLAFLENFSTTADWRLSSTTSLTAILTQTFSLRVSFKVDYLNTPVAGKRNTDTATTIALVALL